MWSQTGNLILICHCIKLSSKHWCVHLRYLYVCFEKVKLASCIYILCCICVYPEFNCHVSTVLLRRAASSEVSHIHRRLCVKMWRNWSNFQAPLPGRKRVSSFTGKGNTWHLEVDPKPLNMYSVSESHRIHVCYIYLHLVDLYGKCR